MTPIRLLVVDDSAYNRKNIADAFAYHPEVEIVGKAADGEEALRLALLLQPDVITLDLEMPRMDGFTFLRILMNKRPTPVIVVSSYAQKENVFRALELGALDFVTKPDQRIAEDAYEVKDQILQKVLLVRSMKAGTAGDARLRRIPAPIASDPSIALASAPAYSVPQKLVGIASSTGGPTALLEIFARLPKTTTSAYFVAQHMPDKFTRTFAERLDRKGTIRFSEAQEGDLAGRGAGFVCPGRHCLEVHAVGADYCLKIVLPSSADRYVPSGDRLLGSIAKAAGKRAIGVVLTGMGDDGLEGARQIREAGGVVLVEAKETAVVYGMPQAVVNAGLASEVLPLPELAERLGALG